MNWLWARRAGGALALLLGALWALQGLNVLHGSAMSGHAQFVALGIIAALLGIWLLAGARRARPGAPGEM